MNFMTNSHKCIGNENAVRVLIENGADIHIVNTMNDNNALMAALSEGTH